MIQDLGERVRNIRKNKGITLTELASASGLSASFISNMERNICSPTVENLQKICEAMGMSLLELLDGKQSTQSVIRKEDREVVYEQAKKVRYESLHFGDNKLDGLIITIAPHEDYRKLWRHSYDEIGLILSGELTITIEDEKYVMKEGDTIYIEAMKNHNLSNDSDTVCSSYWVKQGTSDHV